MTPSKKSPEVEKALKDVFGVDRQESIQANTCIAPPIGCGKPITTFRDEVSRREFTISGLCQDCQDKIFGA